MDDTVGETVEEAAETALSLLSVLGYAGLGLAVGLLVSILISVVVRILRRRHPTLTPVSRRMKAPQRAFFALLGTGIGVALGTAPQIAGVETSWRPAFLHIFLIILIAAAGYLLTAALFAIEDMVRERHEGLEETSHARRVRTQMQVIRRVGVAIVWLSVVGGILLTFESFRAIGASLFASAGVLSLVAGIAAQSSLGNIFAGIQIAFTDALRVGDVVVINGEFGNVEEVTLTYVVVRIWDDRRLILPSSHFTTQIFENWTRREPELLGTVILDLDWFAPVPAMRIELQRLVESTELWDGRTAGVQVVDAQNGRIQVRVVVSSDSSGHLWDLRCLVREGLITWLRENAPYSFPRTRLEPDTSTAPPQEELRGFIEEVEREWEEEKAAARDEAEQTPDGDATLLAPAVVDESDTQRLHREEEARRARREAERADRRAAKKNPAALAERPVRPQPSSEATRVLSEEEVAALESDDAAPQPAAAAPAVPPRTPRTSILQRAVDSGPPGDARAAEPRSAEARLFSGSPEAEERANRLSGPSREDMAEREDTARRRSQQPPEENR